MKSPSTPNKDNLSKESAPDIEEIYHDFRPKILGYVRRLVGGPDAEDVTQEVFLKVNASIGNFRGNSSLSTWIYRIATNAAMDHLRKSGPSKTGQITDELPDDDLLDRRLNESRQEGSPSLDTRLIRKEMNECIRGIVDGLPENYRTVIILSDLEGLTNDEIAGVLDVSLQTVKIRLHRARARLRKELGANCTFYRDERNELACDRKTSPLKFLKN
jgi:RNA polymerase sigma-70 factor, ECF subfamily